MPFAASAFNPEALAKWRCDIFKQNNTEPLSREEQSDPCSSGAYRRWLAHDAIYPGDGKADGLRTQQCLLFTYVFNAFVFMQVFNQINARKLQEGEFNVFAGFFTNILFLSITIITIIVQMVMIELGGKFVKAWPMNNM